MFVNQMVPLFDRLVFGNCFTSDKHSQFWRPTLRVGWTVVTQKPDIQIYQRQPNTGSLCPEFICSYHLNTGLFSRRYFSWIMQCAELKLFRPPKASQNSADFKMLYFQLSRNWPQITTLYDSCCSTVLCNDSPCRALLQAGLIFCTLCVLNNILYG